MEMGVGVRNSMKRQRDEENNKWINVVRMRVKAVNEGSKKKDTSILKPGVMSYLSSPCTQYAKGVLRCKQTSTIYCNVVPLRNRSVANLLNHSNFANAHLSFLGGSHPLSHTFPRQDGGMNQIPLPEVVDSGPESYAEFSCGLGWLLELVTIALINSYSIQHPYQL